MDGTVCSHMYQDFYYGGELISDASLEPAACALADFPWPFEVKRSGYDDTCYLWTPGSDEFDFQMGNAQAKRFLFSGSVFGSAARARELLGLFSQCLTTGGIVHRIELYDDADDAAGGPMLDCFHHKWSVAIGDPD